MYFTLRQPGHIMSYLDLGDFGTSNADCQLWIDHGVLHTFGFNQEEAIRCFQKALTYDASCIMAHYFIAYNNALS